MYLYLRRDRQRHCTDGEAGAGIQGTCRQIIDPACRGSGDSGAHHMWNGTEDKIKVKIDRLVRNEFSELTTYLSNFKCNKKVLSFIIEDDDIQMIEDFIFEQIYIPKNDFTISNMDQSTSIFINGLKLSYIKKIPQ